MSAGLKIRIYNLIQQIYIIYVHHCENFSFKMKKTKTKNGVGGKLYFDEMTKITNSIQSHKSFRKNKSENGRTRTSEYINGEIGCHGGNKHPLSIVHTRREPFFQIR
jgi:hypothetical protein